MDSLSSLNTSVVLEENYPRIFTIVSSTDIKKLITFIFYFVVIIVAVIGNSLVLYVTLRKRRRNAIEISIASMAVSDLLFAATQPLRLLRFFTINWILGKSLCKIGYYLFSVSVYVSTFTMVFIAIDRHLIIKKPFQNNLSHASRRKNVVFVILIWLMAGILSLPFAYFANVINNGDVNACLPFPVPGQMQLIIYVFLIIVQFAIPITITSILYCIICYYILRQENIGQVSEPQQSGIIASRKRTIKMLILILLAFVICWLPFYSVLLVNAYYTTFNTASNEGINVNIKLISKLMSSTSICFNPFIYSWFNSEFWFEVKKLMRCICCK